MVWWTGTIDPLKMHGAYLFSLRPMSSKVARAFSYQCRGILFKPYGVHMRWRYVFGGVMGQSLGGRNTYFSPSGKYALQNTCLKSPAFTFHFLLTAMVMSRRSLSWERTRSKTLLHDHFVGSTLPRTHLQYLACWGLLLASVLMVVREIVRRELPTAGLGC